MIKRTLTTALAALVLAGSVGACSKGDDDNGDGPQSLDPDAAATDDNSADEVTDEELAELAIEYAQCFRDHGIDMPDPEIGPDGAIADGYDFNPEESGASRETIVAAEEACQPIADRAGAAGDQADPEQQQKDLDAMVEVAECMRAKGFDVGDPVLRDDGGIAAQAGLDQDATPEEKQAHQDATKACQEEVGMTGNPGEDGE